MYICTLLFIFVLPACVPSAEVARLVGPSQTMKKLLNPVKILVKDSSQYTRAALGSVIMSLAAVIKKQEVNDHLVPLFLQLLKDTHPEVRLNIISKLDSANEVMSVELLSQALLPAIQELANDAKWRVRLDIIQHIPVLAKQLVSTGGMRMLRVNVALEAV